ncbi:MAG: S8 family peptidase [Lachnospiraceae bacterium]|nr:S8 family peptidase [Lachnospiraceae bacterium]
MISPCKNQALSEDYADFIIGRLSPFPESIASLEGLCRAPMTISQLCMYAPLSNVLPLSINHYPYSSIPSLFTLEDTTPLEASGILRLQNQPVLQLKGQGTVIGIIDTGIDYTHKAFLDNFNKSRIISIWDQTENSGTPPTSQFYGTEYNNDIINAALASENPYDIVPETDDIGHGTLIAGVAGGSEDLENNFIGAAPLAEFIVVKLKPAKQYLRDYYFVKEDAVCYQENDIIFAVSYITRKCLELGKPLSLLMGLGGNRGDHNGSGNLDFVLNRLTEDAGGCVSISMGNEGNKRHHFKGVVNDSSNPELIELRIDERQRGLYMEIWGQNPQIYSVSVTSPTGETLNRVPARMNASENYTFLFEQTVLQIEYKLVEPSAGEELILLRFINPTPGIWRINVYGENNISGTFDAWIPVSGFLYEDTYFLRSDPYVTFTTPAGSKGPISVANYNSYNGGLFVESSRGFTRSSNTKPDITAPGVNILGPSAGNGYTTSSGSSIAAAITAGAVSQFLTWGIVNGNNPGLRNSNIKSYFIRGAKRNNTLEYPNPEWGYGILDIYAAFEVMRGNTT